MAILNTSLLMQIAVESHVVSSSGINRKVCNVWSFYGDNPALYLAANKGVFVGDFRALVWANVRVGIHNSLAVDRFLCWLPNLPGDTPTPFVLVDGGTRGGLRLPLNQCLYVNLASGFRGRNYRGSKRLGPLSEADVVGDEVKPASLALMAGVTTGCWKAFIDIIGGATMTWLPCVWSRQLALATPPPAAQTVADITAATFNKTLGQWKHRRERVVR